MKNILKNKKFLIAIGSIVAIIVIAYLLILLTVKPRVVGVWQAAETEYLEKYDCKVIKSIEFKEDGESEFVLRDAQTDEILYVDERRWYVSGFDVHNSRTLYYAFDPISGTLKNGPDLYLKID